MTFTEAAAQVLRLVGKPLHYKEITDVAIEKNLLSHVGKSPEVTMGARLAALAKKADKENPLVRVKPGVFALREWDNETVKKGLADTTPPLERIGQNESKEVDAAGSGEEAAAAEVEDEAEQESAAPDAAEKRRAEIAADASDLFAAEEDDDEPIFGAEPSNEDEETRTEGAGGRRRRRRRRRGRNGEGDASEDGNDLPTYTVSDAPMDSSEADEPVARREGREDSGWRRESRRPQENVSWEEGASVTQADSLAVAVGKLERGKAGVTLQRLAEGSKRNDDGSGLSVSAAQVCAIARADNLRRTRTGKRPRFRILHNRLGLEETAGDERVAALHGEVYDALGRYRAQLSKSLLKTLTSTPQKALGELIVVLLEAMGTKDIVLIRRPGSHGAELHLAGTVDVGLGEVPTAIVVRRDGREVGRERVTELRGAIHHYASATQGWLITTGQVLSGAREEAKTRGAAPIALLDGQRLAELCIEHGIGVVTTDLRVPSIDSGLFDSIRA